MLNRISAIFNLLRLCMLSSLIVVCISCAGSIQVDRQSFDSNRLAEYSLMKKRLPLIENANDILNQENLQHRKQIRNLELRIDQQKAELACLAEKYTTDMAVGETRIQILQQTLESNAAESIEKIEALTALNDELQQKWAVEVHALDKQFRMQKEAFRLEHQQTLQQHAEKESVMSSQINELEKKIADKSLETASLKIALNEISTKLGEATALAHVLQKAQDESAAQLATSQADNAKLKLALSENASQLTEATARVQALQKARDASAAQLESLKGDNAKLKLAMGANATQLTEATARVHALQNNRDASAANR